VGVHISPVLVVAMPYGVGRHVRGGRTNVENVRFGGYVSVSVGVWLGIGGGLLRVVDKYEVVVLVWFFLVVVVQVVGGIVL
jgi:hypothetical protein